MIGHRIPGQPVESRGGQYRLETTSPGAVCVLELSRKQTTRTLNTSSMETILEYIHYVTFCLNDTTNDEEDVGINIILHI